MAWTGRRGEHFGPARSNIRYSIQYVYYSLLLPLSVYASSVASFERIWKSSNFWATQESSQELLNACASSGLRALFFEALCADVSARFLTNYMSSNHRVSNITFRDALRKAILKVLHIRDALCNNIWHSMSKTLECIPCQRRTLQCYYVGVMECIKDWFWKSGWLIHKCALCTKIAHLWISTSTGTARSLIWLGRSQAKRQKAYGRHEHHN